VIPFQTVRWLYVNTTCTGALQKSQQAVHTSLSYFIYFATLKQSLPFLFPEQSSYDVVNNSHFHFVALEKLCFSCAFC